MEEMQAPKSKSPLLWLAAAAVIVIGGVIAFASGMFKTTPAPEQTNTESQGTSEEAGPATTPTPSTTKYRDGTYELTQVYTSPGGQEKFGLSLTIANDVVTGASFTPMPVGPIGTQKQNAFNAGFKTLVVGKSIDSVSLSVVSGASLTSAAFMKALETIKSQAKI